jgi:hypothetical protein
MTHHLDELMRQVPGTELSNVAFNWAQHPGYVLTQADCDMLHSLRLRYDAARTALRTAIAKALDEARGEGEGKPVRIGMGHLIDAHLSASSAGHFAGTTNWAAHVLARLRVAASGMPPLAETLSRFAGWDGPEICGAGCNDQPLPKPATCTNSQTDAAPTQPATAEPEPEEPCGRVWLQGRNYQHGNSGWGMDFSAPVDASDEDGERIRNEVMSAALSGGMYRPTIRVVGESKWWPQKPADDEPPATAGKEQ